MKTNMREYMKRRYDERMELALEVLGGKCNICGSTKNLEIDHIDPTIKEKNLSLLTGRSLERFLEELKKCQLLCKECHTKKSVADRDQLDARLVHGTLSSYRYCKCELCRKAKSDYMKSYKLRNLGL
jgi:5-methylcytosine-specific restriction endonuclease McrA